ncbi:MAG TPA: hypothetical protein PLB38_03590 [bacterium]|nr:hypothetical protein [bacterium]
MLVPLHNWKDKLKNLISKYPKTVIGFGVLVLAILVFVGWTQAASANFFTDALKGAGEALLGALISVVTMILYYVLVVPLFWLIAVVIQVMVEVASWQLFINEPAVVAGWTIARDLVNVGFIAVLLYIAFGTVISYQKVNWQKDLVKLITAVVLVNFSRMIVGLLIDVSQVIMLTFVNGFRNIAGGNITGNLGLDWYLNSSSKFTTDPSVAAGNFIRLTIGVAMGVLLLSILAMLTAWLLLRIVKLWLLTVMAPFYFLADFFPFLKRFHSYWEKEFTDQLVAGPFMAFGIWFAMSVISQTGQASAITTPRGVLADAQALTGTVTDGSVAKQSNAIFTMIIGAGLLYGVYDMSKSMAGTAGKVGMDVLKKGKEYIKTGAISAAKFTDDVIGKYSKERLHTDLSIGGKIDYFKKARERMQEGYRAWKGKGDAALSDYRRTKAGTDAEASPIWKAALNERMAKQAEEKALKGNVKTYKKNIIEAEGRVALKNEIEKKLMAAKGEGAAAEQRRSNISEAMSKAQSGDFSALKSLMADSSYIFPADLKDKVAKYEGLSGKLSQGKSAIDNLYNQSFMSGGIMGAPELSALVANGVLTAEEATNLAGKNINNLAQENPMVLEKLNNFKSLATDVASGAGIDVNKAAALGLKTDEFDIFTSLQAAQDKEMETVNEGQRVNDLMEKWKQGKLSEQEAKDLGLSGAEQDLVTQMSLEDANKLPGKIEAMKKAMGEDNTSLEKVKESIRLAEKKMSEVKRQHMGNLLKSTSFRAVESRMKKWQDLDMKKMEEDFANYETVEDFAELYVNNSDPNIRKFALKKVTPEDMPAFLRAIGHSSDIFGFYETVLELGGNLTESTAKLVNEYREMGSDMDRSHAESLKSALDGCLLDPYLKENVQELVKKSRRTMPSLTNVLSVDKKTNQVSFNTFDDRETKDFEALMRGEMKAADYDGFAIERADGSARLMNAGRAWLGSRVINDYNYNSYEPYFLQAAIDEKKSILAAMGQDHPNYASIEKSLEGLKNYSFRRVDSVSDAFERFRSYSESKTKQEQ